MINNIKQKFNSEEKKRLLSNFISLSILQGANYILPLITFPYLVRVLGVENFGLIAFAGATIAYFNILTDYGFNLTATREVSIHKEDRTKLIEIFSSVMTIKFILMIISFVLLIILVLSFDKFRKDAIIYFLTFGMVIGQVLFPVWFFEGMEKMKYITYLNLLSKLIFTIAIFVFIHSSQDVYKVPLINSLGYIIAGILSLILIKKYFAITFKLQSLSILIKYLKKAYHIFISNIAISLYTISTIFILGIFTNNKVVGYFAAADKIIGIFKGLLGPFSKAIYPYIAKKVFISKEEGLNFIRKVTIFVGLGTFIISIFVFVCANCLVNIFLGREYQESTLLLKIMSILPFMIGLSNIFGIQTMLNFGRKKAFSKILISGSILNIIISFILVPLYKDIGSAISVVIVESFITIAMFIYLQRSGLKIVGVRNV